MKRIYRRVRTEYIECRTLLHAWESITGIAPKKVQFLHGRRMYLRCTRCTTIREDVLSTVTGELMHRSYNYPEGYSLSRDELPDDMTLRQAMRLEWMKRLSSKGAQRVAS